MSNIRSCKLTTLEWAGLLAACREHEAILPDLLAERTSLELSLGQGRGRGVLGPHDRRGTKHGHQAPA